jgi:glutamate synthase (ferredoxin)
MTVLVNLNHRGACGCEPNTGDGAGINMQMPDKPFSARRRCLRACAAGCRRVWRGHGLSAQGRARAAPSRRSSPQIVAEEGQTLLGWRNVPTDNSTLGATAIAGEPFVRQVFIGRNADACIGSDALAFERKLYVIRKRAERRFATTATSTASRFYIASLSSRTVVYKGMLLADQVDAYFPDLLDPDMEAAIAVVHSRFQHQHLPVVGARPSLPLPDPQRRDQHDPRQRQLDVCAPVGAPVGALWRRPGQSSSSRSSTPTAPTAPSSTTRWSSCTWPAARCTTWR